MKTIEELTAALESGEYAKGNNQFRIDDASRNPEGYCCLGVYATINNMSFDRSQAIFGWPTDDQLFVNKARLLDGHWLIEKIHITESSFKAAGYDVQFQSYLTDLNDDSETFEPVVRALKAFAAGQRAFPPACQFVENHDG